MLQAEKINHQIAMAGNRLIKPLVVAILRVCVVSYVMLASANIQDEQRPWANIRVNAPVQPQEVLERIPPVTRPI